MYRQDARCLTVIHPHSDQMPSRPSFISSRTTPTYRESTHLTKEGKSLGFTFRSVHLSRSPCLTPRPRSRSCLSLRMTFGRIRRWNRFRFSLALSLSLFLTLDLARTIAIPDNRQIPPTRNHMLSIIYSHFICVRPDMIPLTIFVVFSTDFNFGSC
jgi:hypothetical protein